MDDAPLTRREFNEFRDDLFRRMELLATKADLAELRGVITNGKIGMKGWMVGAVLASAALSASISLVVVWLTDL